MVALSNDIGHVTLNCPLHNGMKIRIPNVKCLMTVKHNRYCPSSQTHG